MNSELLGLSKYQLFNKRVCQKHLDKYQLDERGNSRKDGYPCLFSAKEIEHGEPLPDGTIEISGSQLSVVYDPPHLLKGIINNLLSKDMIFKGRIASWKDIQMVYEADCQLGHIKMNKKLTDHHIYGQKIKKLLSLGKRSVRQWRNTTGEAEVQDWLLNLMLRTHIHNWCNIINKILKGGVHERIVSGMSTLQNIALEKYKPHRLRI